MKIIAAIVLAFSLSGCMWQTAYDFEIEHHQRLCASRGTNLSSISANALGTTSAICSDNRSSYVRGFVADGIPK